MGAHFCALLTFHRAVPYSSSISQASSRESAVNRWISGAVVGAIGAILVAGCGGGDDSTTQFTKAEFAKQASAICAKGEREIEAASAKYDEIVKTTVDGTLNPSFQRDAAKEFLYSSILPSLQEELEQLEALGAPAGDEADISKMVKTLSLAIDHFERIGRGLSSPQQYVRFQNEAKAYGLDCSSSS